MGEKEMDEKIEDLREAVRVLQGGLTELQNAVLVLGTKAFEVEQKVKKL